jgi:hypothetical protein
MLIILLKSTNHEAPHCAVSDRVLTSHGVFRYSPQKVKKEEEITPVPQRHAVKACKEGSKRHAF